MSNNLDPDQAWLIWVQTVCQGYQHTTLVDKELIKCIQKLHLQIQNGMLRLATVVHNIVQIILNILYMT